LTGLQRHKTTLINDADADDDTDQSFTGSIDDHKKLGLDKI
jgi:hypothetical protein